MDPARMLPRSKLRPFCQKWKIQELHLFGSTARGEAGPKSDLDLLVTFDDDARWSLWDHIRMEHELSELAGRRVDLVTKHAVETSRNEIRRDRILREAEPFYAA